MTAALYRYGVPNRPIGFATVPPGYVEVQPRPADGVYRDHARHGIVVYDRPLAERDVYGFELIPLLDAEQIEAAAGACAKALAEYRDDLLEMETTEPHFVRATILSHPGRAERVTCSVGEPDAFVKRVMALLREQVATA
ncbi:MAG TPA: hypothetical protein VHE37_10100 [Nevskiaceae bacterium]|nr:hypothetical protein [Nevskiaceae bacterium]